MRLPNSSIPTSTGALSSWAISASAIRPSPSPPAGTSYSTRIDARNTVGVYVDVSANFNEQTGQLTWTFTSIDPTTLDIPVGNVLEGFLPPDITSPEGEGWVSYFVRPKADDPTGTVIDAQATVIFDAGLSDQSSLATEPFSNTIDAGAPTSGVATLPAFSPASFTVSWAGQDDSGGSGIGTFDVFVSDDGSPFTLWQAATTSTSAIFTGQDGHTYGFYSVATDNVGNVQILPTAAQATTEVDAISPTSSVMTLPAISPGSFTVTWSGADNAGGSGLASFSIYVSDDGGAFTPLLTNTTQTTTTFTGQDGHTYGFYSIATDKAGNQQPIPTSAQATTTVQIQAATTTGLTSDHPTGSTYGQPLTFTATVTAANGNAPTGSVDFLDVTTGQDLGTFSLQLVNGSDQASVVVSSLVAGTHTINAIYTSDNSSAFANSSQTLSQTVNQATPNIIWATPAAIAYGTALSNTQLDATSSWTVGGVLGSVAGTFTYTPAASTVLTAGTQTLSVTFTPTDMTDYTTATQTAQLVVNKASPTVHVTDAGGVSNGQPFSATATVTGIGGTPAASLEGVTPTLTYYVGSSASGMALSGAPSNPGTYTVVATFPGSSDYLIASDSATFTIAAANGPTNVTSQVKTTASGLVRNRATGLFGGTITLTNIGSTALTGQLEVVFTGLPPGVTLANASGYTSDGNPYLLVNLLTNTLAPGQSVSFTVQFSDPNLLSIQYFPTIFDESGNSTP